MNFTLGSPAPSMLYYILFPCFGSMSWYAQLGSVPNPDEDPNSLACDQPWESKTSDFNCENFGPSDNSPYYVLVIGQKSYSSSSLYSSVFDFAFYTDNQTFSSMIPIPGNDGKVTSSMNSDGSTATLTWDSTGNENDTYSIWTYTGSIPDGSIPYTACGTEMFMSENSNAQISKSGDHMSVTLSNLDINTVTFVSIVVQRQNGYKASYELYSLNDASMLSPLMMPLFGAWTFCIFFSDIAQRWL